MTVTLTPDGLISVEEIYKKPREEQEAIFTWQISPEGIKASVIKDNQSHKGYLLGSLVNVSIANPARLPDFFKRDFARKDYPLFGSTVLSDVLVAIDFSLVSDWAKKAASLEDDQYYEAFSDIALMVFDKKRHNDKDPLQGIIRESRKQRNVVDLFKEMPSIVIIPEQVFDLDETLLIKVSKKLNGIKFEVKQGTALSALLIDDGKKKH